jgi:hypothetical protein
MNTHRSICQLGNAMILAGAGCAIALLPTSATAQVSNDTVVNILLECAKIDDPNARLACFDNNIKAVGGPDRSTVPGQGPRIQGGGAPIQGGGSAQGFGAEEVRTGERFVPGGNLDEIRAKVTSVRERQPNRLDITLEDGAVWRFDEQAPTSYRWPRKDSIVEIRRGALGGYLMSYDGQISIRISRIR